MFDFFGESLGFLSSIFQFILNTIESLIMAIHFVTSSVSYAGTLVAYMPSILGSCIVMFIGIYLVKFLINR